MVRFFGFLHGQPLLLDQCAFALDRVLLGEEFLCREFGFKLLLPFFCLSGSFFELAELGFLIVGRLVAGGEKQRGREGDVWEEVVLHERLDWVAEAWTVRGRTSFKSFPKIVRLAEGQRSDALCIGD